MSSCLGRPFAILLTLFIAALSAPPFLQAQRQMEHLGSGVVAIHQPDGKVAVSWRLLGTDPRERGVQPVSEI